MYSRFAAKVRDLLHERARSADRFQLAHQRMVGADLIVPIGSDQQQVLHIRLGQQILKKVEGGRVEPLQIVEKQRQRPVRRLARTLAGLISLWMMPR
jgi:hypothetical protein